MKNIKQPIVINPQDDNEEDSSGENFSFIFISWAIFSTMPNFKLLPYINELKETLPQQEQKGKLSLTQIIDELFDGVLDILSLFMALIPSIMDLDLSLNCMPEKHLKLGNQRPTPHISKFGWFANKNNQSSHVAPSCHDVGLSSKSSYS